MLVHFSNINGLSGKVEEIQRFNNTNNIKLNILVETWLAPNASVPFRPYINNITTTNNDFSARGGRRNSGGILIYSPFNAFSPPNCLLFSDPDGCFSVLKIGEIILLAAYISPSQPDSKLDDLLSKAEHFSDGFSKLCIIIGDLNARMHHDTGDSTDNTRGKKLRQDLLNTPLLIQLPQHGKWTTWSGTGCGITDIVLANFDIPTLIVHEEESLGGSDHRPLTLELPINSNSTINKEFHRINIRKLENKEDRTAYSELLLGSYEETLSTINWYKEQSSLLTPQTLVDRAWNTIKSWISSAAYYSLGNIVIKDHIATDFWSTDLEQLRQDSVSQQANLQDLILNSESNAPTTQIKQLAKALTTARRNYRLAIQDRRKQLFEASVDDLSHTSNLSAFFRRVKCSRGRQLRSHCMLDPELINVHAEHFKQTFGGSPAGTFELGNISEHGAGGSPMAGRTLGIVTPSSPAHISDTQPVPPNPTEVRIPTPSLEHSYSHLHSCSGPSNHHLTSEHLHFSFSLTQVQLAIRALPKGKAAGPDGFAAELLTAGEVHIAPILASFLSMVYRLACIPSDWRIATIVPVFKNKGSATDIANYRPIALTCTTRRLYERLLLPLISHGQLLLNDTQAGFRQQRSTLDQAMVLHEVLQGNKSSFATLLDLKAAYDLVDRRILWQDLATHFNFSSQIITRLQDLFDKNQSELVISGNRSNPIYNTRGLLQGSSLSPILFNYFIDGLCRKLQAEGVPKIMVHGTHLNSLLFADDTALVAGNQQDMAKLLKICETWSQEVGMIFAPSKCIVLGPPAASRTTPLRMYNTNLPSAEQATYLGFPFRQRGICWKSLAKARTDKARAVIAMLAPMGFNAKGWAPSASIRVYKAFIRPVMEYGLALHRPTAAILEMYEKVQTLALRTLTSTPRNTSRAGLLRLLQIEPMAQRASDLNFMWAGRLYNSTDASNLAVKLFHRAIQSNRGMIGVSLPRHAMANNLWNHPSITPHEEPLTRPINMLKQVIPKILKHDIRVEMRRQCIMAIDLGQPNVAGAIQLELHDTLPPFLCPRSGTSRAERWLLLQWRLGTVTRHESCIKCGDTLTRAHAADCSGATALLEELHPEVQRPAQPRLTLIDAVLNQYRQQSSQDGPAHSNCAKAITLILRNCRGLQQQQEDGRWVNQDPNNNEHCQPSQNMVTSKPTRSAASLRQSTRNAAVSATRNRTLGRPKKRNVEEVEGRTHAVEFGTKPKHCNTGRGDGRRADEGVG